MRAHLGRREPVGPGRGRRQHRQQFRLRCPERQPHVLGHPGPRLHDQVAALRRHRDADGGEALLAVARQEAEVLVVVLEPERAPAANVRAEGLVLVEHGEGLAEFGEEEGIVGVAEAREAVAGGAGHGQGEWEDAARSTSPSARRECLKPAVGMDDDEP